MNEILSFVALEECKKGDIVRVTACGKVAPVKAEVPYGAKFDMRYLREELRRAEKAKTARMLEDFKRVTDNAVAAINNFGKALGPGYLHPNCRCVTAPIQEMGSYEATENLSRAFLKGKNFPFVVYDELTHFDSDMIAQAISRTFRGKNMGEKVKEPSEAEQLEQRLVKGLEIDIISAESAIKFRQQELERINADIKKQRAKKAAALAMIRRISKGKK